MNLKNTLLVFGVAVAATLSIIQSNALAMDSAQGKQLAEQAINGDAYSLQQLKQSAMTGDAVAENALGAYFDFAQKDYAQAVQWYRKAAEQGHAKAQRNLGAMYFNGQGVPQDYVQAVLWFRKAADQGWAGAQYDLGAMYLYGQGVPQDYAQALQLFRKAAAQRDAGAQSNLGTMYEKGQGVPQDYVQAVQWYRKAADQGWAVAQYNLGAMYFYGQGVPQDYAQALQLFRKAAEQGDAIAQYNLGQMYFYGQGGAQDYVQAVQWYRKAAEQGNVDAQIALRNLDANGQGGEQAQAEQQNPAVQNPTSGVHENEQRAEQSKVTTAAVPSPLGVTIFWMFAITLVLIGSVFVVYQDLKKHNQLNATDKLIQKKIKELAAKGETADSNALSYARWSNLLMGVGIVMVLPGVAFLFIAMEVLKDVNFGLRAFVWIFGMLMVAGGGRVMQRGRAVGRLYELTDKYRDVLLDKGIRSIKDLSALTDSTPDEIVDELKELQEVGLLRQFSVDRTNMKFVENAGWGDTGFTQLKQVAFSCSSCGANNSIYMDASSSSGVCEYCGSSVAL